MLILASRSPQRRQILEQVGVQFEVREPRVVELEDGPGAEVSLQNATRKALDVARTAPDALVLGVDTVVCIGPRIYGKPRDPEEARSHLRALSGRAHEVISGLCLIESSQRRSASITTDVRFRTLEEETIRWYLASGEWRERAGGYAIQGRGAALVESIDGDYLNVVGLPLAALLELEPGLLVAADGAEDWARPLS